MSGKGVVFVNNKGSVPQSWLAGTGKTVDMEGARG